MFVLLPSSILVEHEPFPFPLPFSSQLLLLLSSSPLPDLEEDDLFEPEVIVGNGDIVGLTDATGESVADFEEDDVETGDVVGSFPALLLLLLLEPFPSLLLLLLLCLAFADLPLSSR